ncbi:MAG: hypothetical protein CSB33_02930 [Desulfobacterales bacterium]|nr:MAG: hypothetical protein CSB33_02930 [Desulfobacterales bacterium]
MSEKQGQIRRCSVSHKPCASDHDSRGAVPSPKAAAPHDNAGLAAYENAVRACYHDNGEAYFQKTVDIDPGPIIRPLLAYLRKGAAILDIGCGSGRDLRWLSDRGYAARGLERSPSLAALARSHSGCPVTIGDFGETDFSAFRPDGISMDGILMIGSLVHQPPERMPALLSRISAALHHGGSGLLSLKYGEGMRLSADGRPYYQWTEETLSALITDAGLEIREINRQTSQLSDREKWIAAIFRRP